MEDKTEILQSFVQACKKEEQPPTILTTAESVSAFGTPGVEETAIPVVYSIVDLANVKMNPCNC